jgi:hypothetical protein
MPFGIVSNLRQDRRLFSYCFSYYQR